MNELYNYFIAKCISYGVEPSVAFENDDVKSCLAELKMATSDEARRGYENHLQSILSTQF